MSHAAQPYRRRDLIRCFACLGETKDPLAGEKLRTFGSEAAVEKQAADKGWGFTDDGVLWLCPKHAKKGEK